ncbi:PP0621 family protein [Pseudaquabacterium rugosum]|jgi:uncharacterized protein|uniref:PP0621 family protein n=1 Tax=Pseudaquabacterium rugosum TaxID=2984194 RepID=A0ABU9B7A1_9BURK
MALKYLILLLVVVLVFWWLGRRRADAGADAPRPSPPRPDAAARTMVACAHCGLLLPRGEAVQAGAALYCGPAHRALGPRPPEGA